MSWKSVEAPLPTAWTYQVAEDVALPKLNEAARLDDYLAFAALNNPGLESAFNLWKAALERIPSGLLFALHC